MGKAYHTLLKLSRFLYFKLNNRSESHRNLKMFSQKDYSNKLITEYLLNEKPVMIARFGSTELSALVNYVAIQNKNKSALQYIKGEVTQWWWNPNILKKLKNNAGFFTAEINKVEEFCKMMIRDMSEVDLLGSWLENENIFLKELSPAKRVVLEDLEPFFSINPWTKSLENKKVLVIHPFADTIHYQFEKRSEVFPDGLLPNFELFTIKAVQTIAGQKSEFSDWFEALEYMKSEMEKIDFDIAIIGCGAYGFPLAAHAKRLGKKGFHLGGVTQLLFGIKGRRWVENPILYYPYINLFNDHWIYPSDIEKPKNSDMVEDSCYW